jgi:hypothetical protein
MNFKLLYGFCHNELPPRKFLNDVTALQHHLSIQLEAATGAARPMGIKLASAQLHIAFALRVLNCHTVAVESLLSPLYGKDCEAEKVGTSGFFLWILKSLVFHWRSKSNNELEAGFRAGTSAWFLDRHF